MRPLVLRLILVAGLALTGCGGDDPSRSGPGADSPSIPESIPAAELRALARERGADPVTPPALAGVSPDQDQRVELGMQLFFSRTLSGNLDTACASCHHPDLAGGDGLSLPVGVAARNPGHLGPGREIDPALDLAPNADSGPNVPRNSQTVINTALYEQALFHDGRVFAVERTASGVVARTPESGLGGDTDAGDSLLEAQAALPLVANDEMRGYAYPGISDPEVYRQRLLDRLRGQIDTALLNAEGPAAWKTLFSDAFGAAADGSVITLPRLREAIAAYETSLTFVDSPWARFLDGDDNALSDQARAGARLFFAPVSEGGLGCAGCHSGADFSSEQFYNTAFPQLGRGKRPDGRDLGRWQVSTATQTGDNLYAFRVPSLLNVTATGPWGHTGSFDSLRAALRYHANPRDRISTYDFSFAGLDQFMDANDPYPDSRARTELALEAESFSRAEALLPGRALSGEEEDQLLAFLGALTDPCVTNADCLDPWVPEPAEDPDGNLLVRDQSFSVDYSATEGAALSDSATQLAFGPDENRTTFDELNNCGHNASAFNQGTHSFVRKDGQLGLDAPHGYDVSTWLGNTPDSVLYMDATMTAGGISATYLTDSCWPDLVFVGGDHGGTRLYENTGGQSGFADLDGFVNTPATRLTGAAVGDLDGDFDRELIFGNLHGGTAPVYSRDGSGRYERIAALPMERSSYGISLGDPDGDGYLDVYFGHWSMTGIAGTASAFWSNDQGEQLRPADSEVGTTSGEVPQQWNFTPGFADFTGDGNQDLVVASDFGTSSTLENDGDGTFTNVTDSGVIDDRNGMGSVIADFHNDGKLDWFVTSIFLDDTSFSGNRLYRNVSTTDDLRFDNVSQTAGIIEGWWGWGACGKDFNNDGFVDLFHVNGYTDYPAELADYLPAEWLEGYDYWTVNRNTPSRLYLNDGDGSFTEAATDWNVDSNADGRGITCLDYDRDGDIDIALVNHSEGIEFYENQTGSGAGNRFLNVRVVGASPNTDAVGARVTVSADVGSTFGVQEMTRVVQANSNFNGQNLPNLHFGLGYASRADAVTVRWPDGAELRCTDIAVNQFLVFDRRVMTCPGP